jgi:hypothetical protein
MGGLGFGQGYFGSYAVEAIPSVPPTIISTTELAASYIPTTELAATHEAVTELAASCEGSQNS